MRCPFLVFIPLLLGSCVHRGEDKVLTAHRISSPPAFSRLGEPPCFRTWSDAVAYLSARVEAERLVTWNGARAVPGDSLVIHISEGSRLEHTTAHPQYFEFWMQVPGNLPVNQPFPLHPASRWRSITRQRLQDGGDVTKYSLLHDGEMTLSGMQGYGTPTLSRTSSPVATLTVVSKTENRLVFRLTGKLPIRQDDAGERLAYNLGIDREFTATLKDVAKPSR